MVSLSAATVLQLYAPRRPRDAVEPSLPGVPLSRQDLRKNHLNTGILELLNEVIVQQTALDPVDRLPALVG